MKHLTAFAMFEDMKYSDNFDEIKKWIPLMMKNRDQNEEVAATRMDIGTDVSLT